MYHARVCSRPGANSILGVHPRTFFALATSIQLRICSPAFAGVDLCVMDLALRDFAGGRSAACAAAQTPIAAANKRAVGSDCDMHDTG